MLRRTTTWWLWVPLRRILTRVPTPRHSRSPHPTQAIGSRPLRTMSTKYKRPILTSIFNILGMLALIGAVLCLFQSFDAGVTVAVAGVIYFGIGQAVDYLARTAHSTDRLCTLFETSVADRLRSIESSLSASSSAASQPTKAYYFSTDGQQQGPVSATDLRGMRKDGLIADDTPVLRDGETQWRTFQDFLALTR